MSKLYCIDCQKLTKHNPKLSAIMSGNLVCGVCSRMNGFCTLIKPNDPSFLKTSLNIKWIEWDDDLSAKKLHNKPKVGYSLIMSPLSFSFTWQTTIATEILESNKNYVHFKTKNSEYKLYTNINLIKKYIKN